MNSSNIIMATPQSNEPISLRALEPSDTDLIYLWENNPEMWRYGVSPAPLSRHQIWEYINQYDANPLVSGQLRLIVQAGNTPVGTIDLYNLDVNNRRAFIGIMTAPQYRRKGHAAAAIGLITDYCRNNLGLRQIAATIAADNTASLSLFQKAGFRITSTLPDWIRRDPVNFIDAKLLTKQL